MVPLHAADLDALARLAEDFSPRIECGASGVALDASGLSRLFGSAEGLARELARQAAARGLSARIGVAATRTAATLAARASVDHTVVIPSGLEQEALAPLPLSHLAGIADLIGPALAHVSAGAPKRRRKGQGRNYRLAPAPNQQINKSTDQQIARLERWGLKTLDDLAGLPASDLSARLGEAGLILQRAARGEDERPLVPATPAPSFLQSMRLEWPVDDLQPLSFIVARLCEALEQALAAADRGAISLTTMLRLVTREAYVRTLALPSPMRDARVLRTLVMLDLESHPPGAAVDEVVIDVDIAPGRILQTGLFEPALPAPEALSTLVARLGAVAGSARVGAPALADTHRPGAFEIKPFAPHQITKSPDHQITKSIFTPSVIRRFRPPRAARVRVAAARPVRVDAEDISGDVVMAAGPWRASGGWWQGGWDRDEWDVTLDTGVTCRVAQDRATGKWVVDGVLD
jgi:protein ImuB